MKGERERKSWTGKGVEEEKGKGSQGGWERVYRREKTKKRGWKGNRKGKKRNRIKIKRKKGEVKGHEGERERNKKEMRKGKERCERNGEVKKGIGRGTECNFSLPFYTFNLTQAPPFLRRSPHSFAFDFKIKV